MANYQNVKVAIEERTAILTIDHPPANAFNAQTVMDLEAAFEETQANPEVKTIIITGAGQFFVAGADINEIAALEGPDHARAVVVRGQHPRGLGGEGADELVGAGGHGGLLERRL